MSDARSRLSLFVRSLAAAVWFALWFFVVFPGLILWASDAPFPPSVGVGGALGVSLVLLANYVLMQHMLAFIDIGGGTHAPFDPPQRLVVRGLYRRVRNPMYLIYVAVIVGEALIFASWWILLYAASFWLLAHVYLVKLEEPTLRERFGDEWDRYAASVSRWVPGAPVE